MRLMAAQLAMPWVAMTGCAIVRLMVAQLVTAQSAVAHAVPPLEEVHNQAL